MGSETMQKLYEQYRGLLFTLAYQLTGSAADAEDMVQDVFVKAYEVPLERMAEPKAYLCKMITNRCRDLHRSARRRREQYFGEWLPEPILTSDDETYEAVARGELLSYAMLVLLERLSPSERAVFVLREALGFDYAAIAEQVDKTEANCRKLYSRAQGKMGVSAETHGFTEAASEPWIRAFLTALEQGNLEAVVTMLAEDAVLISDGGGKALSAVHPIQSREHVIRFLLGIIRKAANEEGGLEFELTEINGQPGLIVRTHNRIETAALLHMENNEIRSLYLIRNPDKLQRLER
jgi:RNA polymerase sigma-70 factor (TIGR02957 family)